MMLLTAHGGALNTGRNSRLFFDTIKDVKADVIEVDVRKRKGTLYISHLKALFINKCLSLSFVFDFIKEHGFKVNCDIKERGILKDVIALAKEKGVTERLIFTGLIKRRDLPDITAGDVYVNTNYYFPLLPTVNNLSKIKDILDKSGNINIKGLNLPYFVTTDAFINKANELKIPLSIYTVDDIGEQKRIISHNVANITTNFISDAIELSRNIKQKEK
jgi:hypothetical protein